MTKSHTGAKMHLKGTKATANMGSIRRKEKGLKKQICRLRQHRATKSLRAQKNLHRTYLYQENQQLAVKQINLSAKYAAKSSTVKEN